MPPAYEPEPAETITASAGSVFAHYRRAMRKYEPARYSGHIVVLRSQHTHDMRRSLGWSMVSENVETYDIPGDHHTSITRHIAVTGARIAACLEEASRRYALP